MGETKSSCHVCGVELDPMNQFAWKGPACVSCWSTSPERYRAPLAAKEAATDILKADLKEDCGNEVAGSDHHEVKPQPWKKRPVFDKARRGVEALQARKRRVH